MPGRFSIHCLNNFPDELRETIISLDRRCMSPFWSDNVWKETFDSKDPNFLLVCDADVQAFSLLYYSQHESLLHLLKLAVEEKLRRTGLAKQLLAQIKSYMPKNKIERIYLEVEIDNYPAISFYENQSFTQLEITKNFYGAGRDAIKMMFVNNA